MGEERDDDVLREVVANRENPAEFSVETPGLQLETVRSLNELRRDAHPFDLFTNGSS
jgi:hypothetical protein